MSSGYGKSQGGNRVYFNLKVKRGSEIDPHIEIRKHNGSTYEKQAEDCSYIEGEFAGIDYGTYKVKETEKEKISVTLVNTSTKEVYIVQSAMNSHARGIMLCLCSLFIKLKDKIENINISVYLKNGFSEISIKHNGEYADWYLSWDKQKALHGEKDGYVDYSKLEEVLLKKWKGAKKFIDGFDVYKKLLGSVAGGDQTENNQAPPVAESVPAPVEEPQIPVEEPENLNAKVEDFIDDDKEDDLPF